jgi:hypothetical protein
LQCQLVNVQSTNFCMLKKVLRVLFAGSVMSLMSSLLFAQYQPQLILNNNATTTVNEVPHRITVLGRNVYHGRADSSRVHVFDMRNNGALVRRFNLLAFSSRNAVAVLSSGFGKYVFAAGGSQVMFYDTLGTHLKTVQIEPVNEATVQISRLRVVDNRFQITDLAARRIVIADTTGAIIETVEAPASAVPLLALELFGDRLLEHSAAVLNLRLKSEPDSVIQSFAIPAFSAMASGMERNGRVTLANKATVIRIHLPSGHREDFQLAFGGSSPEIRDIAYSMPGEAFFSDALSARIFRYDYIRTPPKGRNGRVEFITGPAHPVIPYDAVPYFDADPDHESTGVLRIKTMPFGSFALYNDKNDNGIRDSGEPLSTNSSISVADIKAGRFRVFPPFSGSVSGYELQSFAFAYYDGYQESLESYTLKLDVNQWVRQVNATTDSTWAVFSGTHAGVPLYQMIGAAMRKDSWTEGHVKQYDAASNSWTVVTDSTLPVTPKTVLAAKFFKDQDPGMAGIQGGFPKLIKLTDGQQQQQILSPVVHNASEYPGAVVLPVTNPYLMDIRRGFGGLQQFNFGIVRFMAESGAYGRFVFDNSAVSTFDFLPFVPVAEPLFYTPRSGDASIRIDSSARFGGYPAARSGVGFLLTITQGIHSEARGVQLLAPASATDTRFALPAVAHPEDNILDVRLVTRRDTLGRGFMVLNWTQSYLADSLLLAKVKGPSADSITVTLTTLGNFSNPPALKIGTLNGELDLPYNAPVKLPMLPASSGYAQRLQVYTTRPVSNEQTGTLPQKMAITAYPNPFNPTVEVSLNLPVADALRVALYDIQGRKIMSLAEGTRYTAGVHRFRINGSQLSSGVYLLRAEALGSGIHVTSKVTLAK